MNILMLSHYAGAPQYGMEFRSFYMAREWVRQGHKVFIVGASFSHLRKQQPAEGYETIDGIHYLWLKTRSYQGNGMGRVLTMLQFTAQCLRRCKEFVSFAPDMVIASSVYTFDIYPAAKIARAAKAKLVYEVHDLWPLSPMVIGGYSKWHPFIWLLQRGENYAYRHVDKVVSIIDKAFPHMQAHGLDEKRFSCVPNGYLAEEWSNIDHICLPQEHTELFDRLKAEGKTIVGFAGGHTASTAMQVLIDAAEILKDKDNLAYVLVGQGPQKEALMKMAADKGLKNFYFLEPVPKTSIPQVIAHFDIGYMGGVHSFLHQYGTSFNKMTDYMLASKPIVMSVDEPNSVVERVGCGIQVEAENAQQVSEAIMQIADMSPDQRKSMGGKGKEYAVRNLEYGILAQRFVDEVMN